MNNTEKQLTELHQRLQQEINARKSLITYIDSKVYSIQKDESIILEEISKVLSAIKRSDVSAEEDVQLKIEITQFKNNIRKLIKETISMLESKIDVVHEELYDLVTGAEKTIATMTNSQIEGLIESNKNTNKALTAIKQNLSEQLEDLRVNSFGTQDQKIISLDRSFKQLKDSSKDFKSEIETNLKDFSTDVDNKIKAITEFYKTKIDGIELRIEEIEEINIEFAHQEQETIAPKEQILDPIKLSDLQKENTVIHNELKELAESFGNLKTSLESKIKILDNGTPNIQLFLKETLATINDVFLAMEFFKDTLTETKQTLNNIEKDFKDFSKRLQKLEATQKNFITDKQLNKVKIIIADKADNLEMKLNNEIKKITEFTKKQTEEIEEKDKKIKDLEETTKLMENQLFILETNYKNLSEEIELLLELQDLKEVTNGTK